MSNGTYIQVGVTALRSPMGDFLPSVPLYIKVSETVGATGLTPSEEMPIHDVAAIFAVEHIKRTAEKEAKNCVKV